MVYPYKYDMGIKVGEAQIPDPSKWTYQVGDLDTSGSRDARGLLHRAYVATKINYEFEWNAIEWEMLQHIVNAVQKPKFKLTAPDPRTFNTMYKGNYYVGDRTGSCNYYLKNRDDKAVFSLKLKFIEY
jgi:hypothetical protein